MTPQVGIVIAVVAIIFVVARLRSGRTIPAHVHAIAAVGLLTGLWLRWLDSDVNAFAPGEAGVLPFMLGAIPYLLWASYTTSPGYVRRSGQHPEVRGADGMRGAAARDDSVRDHATLGFCLLVGGLMAVGFTVVAIGGLAIGTLLAATGVLEKGDFTLGAAAGMLGTAAAGYSLAGLVGGTAFWLLQGLRSHLVGWLLLGWIIGSIIYGALGVTAALAYEFLGVNLLDLGSVQETWSAVWWTSGIAGVLTGTIVGVHGWRNQRAGHPFFHGV